MGNFTEVELTDSQIAALCADTHIETADPNATETIVRTAWVMLNGRRYVGTVYSQKIALDMLESNRATEMRMTRCFRHPQTDESEW
jgi:hypothetical protein